MTVPITHTAQDQIAFLPVARIRRNPDIDPRSSRNPIKYAMFRESIRTKGVMQPILVRPVSDDPNYDHEVVAGNTRLDGSIDERKVLIPAMIRKMSAQEARTYAAIENLQRDDLSPVDEGRSAAILLAENGNDHAEVMKLLGWNRQRLNSRLLLTHATPTVSRHLINKAIKLGHAELLCPMLPSEQDDIVAKIIERGLSVQETAERLLTLTRKISSATFDTAECAGCPHNSSTYSDLFAASVGDGQCQSNTCWDSKVESHVEKSIRDAKAEFGLVFRSSEVAKGSYNLIATDGDNAVGHEQAGACRTCASYGAVVNTTQGQEGLVQGRYCFDKTCHGEMTAKYSALVAEASMPAQGQGTTVVIKPTASSSSTKPLKASPPKPRTLRTALRRVQHTVFSELATRQVASTPAYAFAQAVASMASDLKREVASGVIDQIFKSAGIDYKPISMTEKAKLIITLAELGEQKLVEMITSLSALATQRTILRDDFEANEGAQLSKMLVRKHDLRPEKVFTVDEMYLGILTKDELLEECASSGFAAAYEHANGVGSFKKMVTSSKVKDLAGAMLKLDGFAWTGYLPAFLKDFADEANDTPRTA